MNKFAIYVINLDCSPKRLQAIKAQLDFYGLNFDRISAIKGIDLSNEETHKNYWIVNLLLS